MPEMSVEQMSARSAELRQEIDDRVTELFQMEIALEREVNGVNFPPQVALMDYIICCAWQAFSDKGHRMGDVRLITREESMPMYIVRGIMASAQEAVERGDLPCAGCEDCAHDEEEDRG